MRNTKNNRFYYTNEILEFHTLSDHLSISRNVLSYTKSYKIDKIQK